MKKTIIICITIVIVNIIYSSIEPTMILNEIYNSIVQQNKNTNDVYAITNSITEIEIHMIQAKNKIMFNTDNIIINNSIHIKNIYLTTLSVLGITIINSICIKIKATLYVHEITRIKKIIYLITTSIIVYLMYYTEITTNILLKKNLNSTEILNTITNTFTVTDYIIGIITIIIYYLVTKNKELNKKTIKDKKQTKYLIWITYIVAISMYAQYSINESILILIYADGIYQIINVYKNIRSIYNK